jgi:hypothetical protein
LSYVSIQNGLKQGDTLSPLLFDTVLQHTIRKVKETVGLKLKGTYLPMVFADDVYLLAKTLHNIKKKTEVPLVATEEVGIK